MAAAWAEEITEAGWAWAQDRLTDLDVRALAELAAWTGMVGRALSWRRSLAAAGPADLVEYGDRVGGWLAELLQPRLCG